MEAKRYLEAVGTDVSRQFVEGRALLSFEEYVSYLAQNPWQQARNAAQYLRDAIDFFGTETVSHPSGPLKRFKIFDRGDGNRASRVAGQEEVQNALYRLLGTFIRARRVNKLILLHGPNGSAKSTLVDALKRGLEHYSMQPEGALYRIQWVFPTGKLVKGSIGFGDHVSGHGDLTSYAHLDAEQIDLLLNCEMKDPPLFLLPQKARMELFEEASRSGKKAPEDFVLSARASEGELCHKCRRIYSTLLSAYGGDYLKVLRHIRVERFNLSRRYLVGTVTVEPQMSVDASYHQVTADRSQLNLPAALQNTVLYEPSGPLVTGNRGLIEYADLLKRPLEAFKYLLGASETGEVPLEHFILQLDEVMIASSNEKHLAAFKELPDFASFKARIELVRVPYLRRFRVEQDIYSAQLTQETLGKHVAPHAIEVAAKWAVLTRLKKPIAERYPSEVREAVERMTPSEKLHLYDEGRMPERLNLSQAKELRKNLPELYGEADAYPNYEGRTGASAREMKTALFNAAQNPDFRCLTPLAVFEELESLCKDKSVYEFLQQEVMDGYHDPTEFIRVVEAELLDQVDDEVRESMGLVSEGQYVELFERYIQSVSHWVKGEKMRNRITGEMERPDESRMGEMEGIMMPKGEDVGDFRRSLIAQVGAHRLDNPDGQIDYRRIFPDLFKALRSHFFEERKRVLGRNAENILKHFSGEKNLLSAKEQAQVLSTLQAMQSRYGYCELCARDSILFLVRKRYAQ